MSKIQVSSPRPKLDDLTQYLPLQWPVKEVRHPYPVPRPLLTILIPTFNRSEEMVTCVRSIADQIAGAFEDKVEIVISDNASTEEVQDLIRALSTQYPFIHYYLNALNGGAELQFLTAPHRARGEWLWVFGDDDLLTDGGVRMVVEKLERDRPAFLTLNRCVVTNDLSRVTLASKHDVPSCDFADLVSMMGVIGVDQFSFLTSQIYLTDVARWVDENYYSHTNSNYIQIAYYLDGFSHLTAAYEAAVHVVHRWNENASGTHTSNFLHLATTLPRDIVAVARRAGLPDDILERLGGGKFVGLEARSDLTYVDNVLSYLLHSIARGQTITKADWDFFESQTRHWKPGRAAVVEAARRLAADLAEKNAALSNIEAELAQTLSRQGGADALKRLAAAPLQLQADSLRQEHAALTNLALEIARQLT